MSVGERDDFIKGPISHCSHNVQQLSVAEVEPFEHCLLLNIIYNEIMLINETVTLIMVVNRVPINPRKPGK